MKREHLQGNENLGLLINKSENFPTRENFEVKASGNLGFGLIKTINA